MTESKYCRCDEPLLNKEYYTAIEIHMEGRDPNQCVKCMKVWKKYKDIRGTELLDYPIETEFLCPRGMPFSTFGKLRIRLIRDNEGLCLQYWDGQEAPGTYGGSKPGWRLAMEYFYAICMLQDRFEIVEEE